MDHVLEIENLTKDYETGFWRKKRVRALDDLSLAIEPGGIFGFLGGNGAGKTTTIKILMGLLFPTSGSARILGKDIANVEMRRRIGYCPENPYFYDYLTAIELMDYFGRIFGLEGAERGARSRELLTAVGLNERDWKRQLRKFSKGMLQRVGLAQALINRPELVFFDEPMSGLDPVGRREIRELIVGLRNQGTTVFMSTHILSDVEALCDKVAVLRGGRLAAHGSLAELLMETEGSRGFEIMAAGTDTVALSEPLSKVSGATVSSKPGGTAIEVIDENDIERVIGIVRGCGGSLISVNPVKQSLEELFVEQDAAGSTPD
jgi:ABC-2 type transport system ATP-binding protein